MERTLHGKGAYDLERVNELTHRKIIVGKNNESLVMEFSVY